MKTRYWLSILRKAFFVFLWLVLAFSSLKVEPARARPTVLLVIGVEVTANPTSLPADGVATTTIRATVLEGSLPVADGTTVSFSTNLGSLSNASSTTSSGSATVTLSSLTAGTATVTATSGGVAGQTTVTFTTVATSVRVSANPTSLPADGISVTRLTATLIGSLPVPDGTPVTFSTTLGNLSADPTTTTNNSATTLLFAPTTAGTATITATIGQVSGQTTVTFTAVGPTRYVTTTGHDIGVCASLKDACLTIGYALSQATADNLILVAAGTYTESNIVIDKNIIIRGEGPGQTIIQAGALPARGNGRVFGVAPNITTRLVGMTIQNGWTSGSQSSGAGIANLGDLTVERAAILNNTVEYGGGGGIYNQGSLKGTTSTLAGNRVYDGAVPTAAGFMDDHVQQAGLLTGLLGLLSLLVVAAFIRRRGQPVLGGWVLKPRVGAPAPVFRLVPLPTNFRPGKTFLAVGGLLLLLLAACFPSNTAPGYGSAILNRWQLSVEFSTLAHNFASEGGAIYTLAGAKDSTLKGVVLSGNEGGTEPGDCGKATSFNNSKGYNISIGHCSFGGAGDHDTNYPQVETLQPNGTVPLLPDSVAIQNVDAPSDCPAIDQQGTPRSTPCDSGALVFSGVPRPHLSTFMYTFEDAYASEVLPYTLIVFIDGPVLATGIQVQLTLPGGMAIEGQPTAVTGCSWTADQLKFTCGSPFSSGTFFKIVFPILITTSDIGARLEVSAAVSADLVPAPIRASSVAYTVAPPPLSLDVGPQQPYTTIQWAVNDAGVGAVIRVHPGVYKENIRLNKDVTIRSVEGASKTIIDGAQEDCVVQIREGVRVTLDGFTIRNGHCSNGLGGGIYSKGNLSLANSFVINNSGTVGGGIYNNGSQITITNTTFRGNHSERGGGLANYSEAVITNSAFYGNSAKETGGAIDNNESQATITNSVFAGNSAVEEGGAIRSSLSMNRVLTITNSTFAGNSSRSGAGIEHYGIYGNSLTIRNSIFYQNEGKESDIFDIRNTGEISYSLLQNDHGGVGNQVGANPSFARNPGANGSSDYGDLRLNKGSPAIGMGQTCPVDDLTGVQRKGSGCSAGAYEYTSTLTGSQLLLARVTPLAAPTTHLFENSAGTVTLEIPEGALDPSIDLAFSLGQPTYGDGRAQAVVFTAYDGAGQPLPEDFAFQAPVSVTLEYDRLLVTHGPESSLMPVRFDPFSETWLPFTAEVQIDLANRTTQFFINQSGQYGLFSLSPGVYAAIRASTPQGVRYLPGGAQVTYTLQVYNADFAPAANLLMTHTLPAGLTFVDWVNANGAAISGNTITWNIGSLAALGQQQVTFTAQVSTEAQYQGQALVSAAALTSPGGLDLTASTRIQVNAPTTPMNDQITTRPGASASLRPLANDDNPDQSSLAIIALGVPAHGSASLEGETVTYIPQDGFQGNDSFSYTLQDGEFTRTGTINVRVANLAFLTAFQTLESGNRRGGFLPEVIKGSLVTYTFDLSSLPDGEIAQNVQLTATLPQGIQFVEWVTPSGATLQNGVISWSAAQLSPGTPAQISFRAVVVGGYGDIVENTIQLTAANADPLSDWAAFQIRPPYWIYHPIISGP